MIDRHQAIIHQVCRLYEREAEDRRDLFQEIVLQLWRAYPAFRGEAKVSTWMYRIALNTAITRLRHTRRRPRLHETLPLHLPDEPPDSDHDEARQWLYRAIDTLSPVDKALVLLYLEAYSYDDMAAILGLTPNHVGVKLNRIKKHLRTRLATLFSND